MKTDKENLFRQMAISNPLLYKFVYDISRMPDASVDLMLGIVVGVYDMLESEMNDGI